MNEIQMTDEELKRLRSFLNQRAAQSRWAKATPEERKEVGRKLAEARKKKLT